MVNIRSGNTKAPFDYWLAASTDAICIYRLEIISKGGMAKAYGPGRGYGIAKALVGRFF